MANAGPLGCYFLLSAEPTIGSLVEMEITLPPDLGGLTEGRFLCQGKVVQVEKNLEEGRSGVLCTIEQYRMVSPGADRPEPENTEE
jgi:hypothetical protein